MAPQRETTLATLAFAAAAAAALALLPPAASSAATTAPATESFDVRHEIAVDVPDGAQTLRMWMVLPQDDPAQKVSNLEIDSPHPTREVTDSEGNRMLFLELDLPAEDFRLVTTFDVTREEVLREPPRGVSRPLTPEEREAHAGNLGASTHVVLDERIERLSRRIVGDGKDPVVASRRIYDWLLDNIDYWVKDPANKKASPVGSTEYCLTTKTGNCTDFHSLYTSLARAAGIPSRIVYGSLFKKELAGLDVDQSYHCWLEVFAPEVGWYPVDVAVADIYVGDFRLTDDNRVLVRRTTADGFEEADMEKVDYYFGNLEPRRVTWSVGRDLTLAPPQQGGPVNALPKAYVEIDGEVALEGEVWTRKLTYREKERG